MTMNFNNSYANLDTRLFNKQPPTPLANPKAGHFNPIIAEQLGWLSDEDLMARWVDILSGNYVPDGFEPLAMAYAGHQFGHWAGQLGDGRGLLMAQVNDKNGQLTDLHLKGMGLTPYSRMGDGRAVLRSTIREYLCGHAMTCLGIKSSTALGFVTSDTPVRREKMEQGAALMRVADTHIRLGHIEWIASFAPDLLPSFTKYMIETYYPDLTSSNTPVNDFVRHVVKNTARMIANWQLIGFAHGVMNTDNLSITGSTIDYGPFGFLERFDPAWINNHSDYAGRYSYQNQPAIGHWNLNIWMMHFMPLSNKPIFNHESLDSKEEVTRQSLAQCLDQYETYFMRYYQQGVCNKLGLPFELIQRIDNINNVDNDHQSADDLDTPILDESLNNQGESIVKQALVLAFELLQIIEDNKLDYTNSFRSLLAVIEPETHPYEVDLLQQLKNELSTEQHQRLEQWLHQYSNFINKVIATCQNLDNSEVALSIDVVVNQLESTNPVYILRNAMAQKAIEQAEAGEFEEVDRLFKLLTTPFNVQDRATQADTTPPAKEAKPLVISCSS